LEKTYSKFGETAKTSTEALSQQKTQYEANTATVRENILYIEILKNENALLNEQLKVSKKQYEEGTITQEQYNQTLMINTERINENKLSISALNAENKNLQKEMMAVDTSMVAQEQQLSRLKREYTTLTEEERNNVEIGGVLLRQIQDLDAEVKSNRASIGEHQRKVGDYEGALKVANMSLGEMRKELRALMNEGFAGKSQEEIDAMKKRMGELKGGINKAKLELGSMSNDTLPAVNQSVRMVSDSVNMYAQTMLLAGGLNENQTKSLRNIMKYTMVLNSAMQLITKTQQAYVSGSLKATAIKLKNGIVTAALTIKTYALAVAQGVATAATWLWATAIKAFSATVYNIPVFGWLLAIIGAIIAAVVAMVKYWNEVVDVFKSVGKWFGFVSDEAEKTTKKTKSYKESMEELKKAKEKVVETLEHEIKLMKAAGKSTDDVAEAERRLLNEKIELTKVNIKLLLSEGYFGEERKKNIEEQFKSLKDLKKELEIFDVSEKTRRQKEAKDRAEAEKKKREDAEKELNKYIEAEKKAAAELMELQAMTDEEKLQATIERLRLQFEITTKELNKESSQYKLAKKKLNDDIAAENEKYIKGQIESETKLFEEKLKIIENDRKAAILSKKIEYSEKAYYIGKEEELNKELEQINLNAKNKEIEQAQYFIQLGLDLELWKQEKINEIQLTASEQRIEQNKKEYEQYRQQVKASINTSADFANQISDIFKNSIDETGLNMKKFTKQLLVLLLDTLQKQVMAGLVASTVQSFSSENTLQAIATAAMKSALITAAYQTVKGLLMQEPKGFMTGGYTGTGRSNEIAGIVHKNEIVWSRKNIIEAGGVANVEALRQGFAMPAFSNNNAMIEAIKAIKPVVSVEEITKVTKNYNNRINVSQI